MEELEEFPFVVGEKVEAKSNIKGYRGAWFRCEIKDIRFRKGEIWCSMQYSDFPDEKVSPTKAYQQDLAGKKRRVLMLRPSFPTLCQEFDGSANSSVGALVVSTGDWQVGDLVDWWSDGCFWGAKITAVPNKDFVQVDLPNAPFGEGGSYEAAVKDIRPSLEWSVEELWTVPCLKGYSTDIQRSSLGINQISASLIGPADQLERGKNKRIFIARQESLRYTVARSSLLLDEEIYLKRKAQVLEADHTSERRYIQDVEQHSNSSKKFQMERAITPGMPTFGPPPSGELKDTAAITLPRRLTRTFTSNVGDKTTLTRQISRSQKSGIEIGTNLRGAFPLLNKPSGGKDQLEYFSAENAAEHLDLGFLEQVGKGKDSEAKTYQIGEASGSKEREPLTWKFCQHGDEKKTCELCMLGWEEEMGTASISGTGHLYPNFNKGCESLSICNQTSGGFSDHNVDTLVGEGKSVNVDELSVASAVISLEELVSRVVWLKGVLQLGLKGWSQERSKQKWMLCERESSACEKFSQDWKNESIVQKSDKTLLEGALRSSVEIPNLEICNPADRPKNTTEI